VQRKLTSHPAYLDATRQAIRLATEHNTAYAVSLLGQKLFVRPLRGTWPAIDGHKAEDFETHFPEVAR
jgi:hypothetical protein